MNINNLNSLKLFINKLNTRKRIIKRQLWKKKLNSLLWRQQQCQ